MDGIPTDQLRQIVVAVHRRLRRNKVLVSKGRGSSVLIVDGHESHASFRRHCAGCLERTVTKNGEEVVQFYHRYVAALLTSGSVHVILDLEPQRRGENEVAAARRLINRVNEGFGDLYDLVLADALYADGPFWREVRALGKHILVVLKNENRSLVEDARALFKTMEPIVVTSGRRSRFIKDAEGFLTWPQAGEPVRVVQSVETEKVKRQLDKRVETNTSEWMWVTSLPKAEVASERLADLGHTRWAIENQGFNEIVNAWHADHVYKHSEAAFLNFILITFLALDVFQVFYARNLKAVRRRALRRNHVARLIMAEYYAAELANDSS